MDTWIWQCGRVLLVPRNRLQNWFRALVRPAKTSLLSCNRTHCRVVIGVLTGHNTLRRNLYLVVLMNIPIMQAVWRWGGKLSPRFAWVQNLGFTLTQLFWFLFLGSRGCKSLILAAAWDFIKGTVLPWLGNQIMGHKGPIWNVQFASGPKGLFLSYHLVIQRHVVRITNIIIK
jgi:hypothetical protein